MNETQEPQAAHSPPLAWAKLYHRSGLDVRIPIPVNGQPLAIETCRNVLASVDNLLAAGWLTREPGVAEGENKEMIAHVAKRIHEDRDGGSTPIVDLYRDEDKFAVLSVYLNNLDQERDFERASGLQLTNIQAYVGSGKLERGASKQTDGLIARAPKAFAVCWKDNPKHDPNETDPKKKKPKRIFARWPDLPASGQPTVGGEPPAPEGSKPKWFAGTLERIQMESSDKLKIMADKATAFWERAMNGERVCVGHTIGLTYKQLLFLARSHQEITDIDAALKAAMVRMPGVISQPWADHLAAYSEQRTKEI